MGGATYNNKIYLFGGYDSHGDTNSVAAYDTTTDSWSAKQNMPVTSGYAVAETVGSKIFVFPQSRSGGGIFPEAYSYDPQSNSWGVLATYSGAAISGRHPATIGTDIYFVGRDPVLVYDTLNDSWSEISSPGVASTGNIGESAVEINGLIFLFDEVGDWAAGMEVFSIGSSAASQPFYRPNPVTVGAAAKIGNSVYLSGGAYSGYLGFSDEFYRYDLN